MTLRPSDSLTRPMPDTLTPGVRRGYALGSVATGTFGTVPGLLLLPYLTDTLGIAALVAGVIVFAPKAWDVILNPDQRAHQRPIVVAVGASTPLPAGRRGRSGGRASRCCSRARAGRRGWPAPTSWCCSWLCATAYSFFQVPYVSMPAEMTADYAERTRLMTWRVAILALAILLSGATAPIVVAAFDGETTGYRVMGVYIATIIVVGALGAWRGTRSAPELPVDTADGTLVDQLRLVRANPQFRALLTTFVLQAVGIGAMLAGVAYVADDLLGTEVAATILFAAFVAPALIVTPLWERFAGRHGKKVGYQLSTALLVVGALVLFAARQDATWLVYPAAAVVGVGYAGAQVFPLAMLPDVAAADAAQSGQNRIGVFTGVWTAGETLGLAIGPGLFAVVLAIGGYVSSTTDVTQSDRALTAIALGFSVVPAVIIAVSAADVAALHRPEGGRPWLTRA